VSRASVCDVCGAEPVMAGFTVCESCAASIATSGLGRHVPSPENRPNPYAALDRDPEDYYDEGDIHDAPNV
jgi:hypothetical protein